MIKSHLLYQLSYGVGYITLCSAKVSILLKIITIFPNFYGKIADFYQIRPMAGFGKVLSTSRLTILTAKFAVI